MASRSSASPRQRRPAGCIPSAIVPRVRIFHAADCSLCARAIDVVNAAREDVSFELQLVDIGGVAELEARYRELLPVVEIDGEVAFTYFVDPEALRQRLRAVVPAGPEDP